jgi:hypothetical protein
MSFPAAVRSDPRTCVRVANAPMGSSDRILTTHVGSLPRPHAVVDVVCAEDRGEPVDRGGRLRQRARVPA